MIYFDFGSEAQIVNDNSVTSYHMKNIKQVVRNFVLDNVEIAMCNLNGTRFIDCVLTNFSFHKMILGKVLFYQCDLSGTRFYHATFEELIFVDCNMTDVVFHDFDEGSDIPIFILNNCNTTGIKFVNYDESKILISN